MMRLAMRAVRGTMRPARERGQMIIIFAVLFVPVTVIIGAVAVDASMWQSERRGAQKDADLSVRAGAYELLAPTPIAGIQVASPRVADAAILARAFDELEALARAGRDADTVAALRRMVPEFAGMTPAQEALSQAQS